jgi:hypothetical protein
MPGLPGRFPKIDSNGCLVELVSNMRASLPRRPMRLNS